MIYSNGIAVSITQCSDRLAPYIYTASILLNTLSGRNQYIVVNIMLLCNTPKRLAIKLTSVFFFWIPTRGLYSEKYGPLQRQRAWNGGLCRRMFCMFECL